tara:strand:- start:330 stop:1058 length:729 start_codon:yes stop_codon:yes gene_type:complete
MYDKGISYIFDVDGTLTPSRKEIEHEFWAPFLIFCRHHDVYLVTGSDRQKTLEQLGLDICYTCKRVYNCSGSDVWERDRNVYTDDWTLPTEVEDFLLDELYFSTFPLRNGNHIERRPGTVNFSILGRDKDPFLGRQEYVDWDKRTNERADIADRLRNQFPDLYVALGGQTGLDIAPKGRGKEQILRDFPNGNVKFYGDKMDVGGNDYSLGQSIVKGGLGSIYTVRDYRHTWELLQHEVNGEL